MLPNVAVIQLRFWFAIKAEHFAKVLTLVLTIDVTEGRLLMENAVVVVFTSRTKDKI